MGLMRRWFSILEEKINWRKFLVLFCDIIFLVISWYGALLMRFDFIYTHIPSHYLTALSRSIILMIGVTIVIYYLMHLYQSVWSFFSATDARRVMYTYLILIPLHFLWHVILGDVPLAVIIMAYFFSFLSCAGMRAGFRLFQSERIQHRDEREHLQKSRVMIIGAGAAGCMVLREMRHSEYSTGEPVCLIDDNSRKKGREIDCIPIVGGREEILSAAENYAVDEIVFAIPSASAAIKREILEICRETKCQIQTVPGLYQIMNGEVHLHQIQPIELEDLLGRGAVRINMDEIKKAIEDLVILVTGGGGSIGSELCRQIAACAPKKLIIMDIYENSAYDLQQELKRKYGGQLDLQVRIGSVRSRERVDAILEEYHPDLIFHAAAHKHVPLMEDSPVEAIKNNVFGTLNVAQSAAAHHVKRMLLISTDKAVNPTNIMGASKRLCEMIIQRQSRSCSTTAFMAVRFGNVLGSNGSVVPLFKKQIAAGGPVTVTHKDITRYFMTIPEAVSLVLEAMYYSKGGEIFVLDMGKPVKIDDMARNLIRLSGFEPDVDMPIVYTGLRPGEKLYEELLMDEEGMGKTENDLIFIGRPIEMDDLKFEDQLLRLKQACEAEDPKIKTLVAEIVPTYHPKAEDLLS